MRRVKKYSLNANFPAKYLPFSLHYSSTRTSYLDYPHNFSASYVTDTRTYAENLWKSVILTLPKFDKMAEETYLKAISRKGCEL